MKKYNRIMEYFWLVIGVLTAVFAIREYWQGRGDNMLLYYMPALAFILFGMRRWYNNRLKKEE